MRYLKKLRQYIPGFRQLSPRSMAIALTYYAVAMAALFSGWYWGLILLALPFLLFNILDLNRGRGKLVPLLAACAAGLAVLCGTAGVLSAGGLPSAEPVARRTALSQTAQVKPSQRALPTPATAVLATIAPTGQAQYAYVAAKGGKVFHRPDCASARRIKPENLIGFHIREDAVAAGCSPCKKCKP